MVSVRPLLASEHGRGGSADQGDPQPVQHQPAAVRRGGAGAEPGLRVRPPGAAQALAHAHAEGPRALHQDEDIPRGRDGGAQAGGQPVQDRPRQAHEDRQLQPSHG